MKYQLATGYAAAGAHPAWHGVRAAWRALALRHVLAAFLLGCLYFIYEQANILQLMLSTPYFPGRPALLASNFLQDQLAAFSLVACLAVAHYGGGAQERQVRYLVAVIVSAAIVGPLEMLQHAASFLLTGPPADDHERAWELLDALVGGFLQWLILGGTATFIYTDRRRAQAARARRDAAELERARSAKRTLESRLQAMQARVEPQFLFNTLAQVRDLYRADAGRGARMLENLIAYLRAAMPRMRDTSSTVGQEIELARAWLDIVEVRLGERLVYTIECPPDARQRRFPPMLLLPLVDMVVGRGSEQASIARSIRVEVNASLDRTELSIADSGTAFDPDAVAAPIAAMRERLLALFGDGGRLVIERIAQRGTRVVLRIPSEQIDGPPVASTG